MPSARKSKPAKSIPRITSTAEFARYVGLARTTVSRVLNSQPGLRKTTVDTVQRAMAETGFTPNAYALHLKGRRTALVAVCVENLLTPPAVRKLAALQRALRDRGYGTLIEVLDPGAGLKVVRHFLSMRVEAIMFLGHFDEAEIAQRIADLVHQSMPHVVIDQSGVPGAHTVSLDRISALQQVMTHLLGLGHTSFGLLGLSGPARSLQDRLEGIARTLAARGFDPAACTRSLDHLHPRRNDFEYGRLLAGSFLAEPRRPGAFIALNDEIAVGAMHGFQEHGLRVPADLSLTGFNNQDLCEITTPGLTSVDQQIAATVNTAVEVILTQIGRPAAARPILRMIEPVLVLRGSTGPAPH